VTFDAFGRWREVSFGDASPAEENRRVLSFQSKKNWRKGRATRSEVRIRRDVQVRQFRRLYATRFPDDHASSTPSAG
jgi:hypothetical protein